MFLELSSFFFPQIFRELATAHQWRINRVKMWQPQGQQQPYYPPGDVLSFANRFSVNDVACFCGCSSVARVKKFVSFVSPAQRSNHVWISPTELIIDNYHRRSKIIYSRNCFSSQIQISSNTTETHHTLQLHPVDSNSPATRNRVTLRNSPDIHNPATILLIHIKCRTTHQTNRPTWTRKIPTPKASNSPMIRSAKDSSKKSTRFSPCNSR